MRRLVIDIETTGNDFENFDEITQHSLTRWIEKESNSKEEYSVALQGLKDELGFSPHTGFIVAIGLLDVEQDKGVVYYQDPDNTSPEDFEENNIIFKRRTEQEMLTSFWEGMITYQQIITFNGYAFDIPFIYARGASYKIKPTTNLMPPRFASNSNHIDLLEKLSFYGAMRKKGNLHMWCKSFGIESPKQDGVSGDDVAELFRNKEYLKIARYNVGDIRATRELYFHWRDYYNTK